MIDYTNKSAAPLTDETLWREALALMIRWENNSQWDKASYEKLRTEYETLCAKLQPQMPFSKSRELLKAFANTYGAQLTPPTPSITPRLGA